MSVEIQYLVKEGGSGMPVFRVKELKVGYYPSGEPVISWAQDLPAKHETVTRVMVRPASIATLLSALFWIDALMERGNPAPELILPFLSGSRQDRLNDEGDYLFTAKSIAKMINRMGLPRVVTLDPHSEVMPALIDRCQVIHLGPEILKSISPERDYVAVVAPDAGATKRAHLAAQHFGVPVLHAWKTRDVSDGSISGFGVEPHEQFSGPSDAVLVVDDICDGGWTFLGLAEHLTQWRDLFVTHGIFSKGSTELLAQYGSIFTTDSVPHSTDGVNVIPVCLKLLEQGAL